MCELFDLKETFPAPIFDLSQQPLQSCKEDTMYKTAITLPEKIRSKSVAALLAGPGRAHRSIDAADRERGYAAPPEQRLPAAARRGIKGSDPRAGRP